MDIKDIIRRAVEKNQSLILDTEKYLWEHPQTGYKEWEADKYLKGVFKTLGYEVVAAGDIPGFYTDIVFSEDGPCVAILGEMDALPCQGHPAADPETMVAHACGHHCQCAALVGVAAALKDEEITKGLTGSVRLVAVPAEEIVDLQYRIDLINSGTIKYLQGKSEYIYRGYFDGVDMAMLIHASKQKDGTLIKVRNGATCGCIVKKMVFYGKAAHAGARPEQGINALYAATLAINAANALRERFRDDDHIRFHPIITEGGSAISVIPSRVVVESYLRGANVESMLLYNGMVNQAFAGAALAIGAQLEINDYAGALPMQNDAVLKKTAKEAIELLEGAGTCMLSKELWSPGGTDLGNLGSLIPVVQPSSTGTEGAGHSKDFTIVDPYYTCVIPAECLVMMMHILLKDGALRAHEVLSQAQPVFKSKEEYLAAMDSMSMRGEVINYAASDDIRLKIK